MQQICKNKSIYSNCKWSASAVYYFILIFFRIQNGSELVSLLNGNEIQKKHKTLHASLNPKPKRKKPQKKLFVQKGTQ